MIAQILGKVAGKTERSIIVVAGGVGYEVFCTTDLLSKLADGAEVTLHTHLNVREDAQDLYGFTAKEDLKFFKLLLNVSGIGPRSALNILEVAKPEEIRRAVVNQDAATLHAVNGIGKKTAEKLVVELKDRLEITESTGVVSDDQSALEAIVNLGYSTSEARQALRSVKDQGGSLEEKVKAALKALSRA
ncbi:MAG: Holliday junction branch migration protein RuvA [Patescibacteria group bacterium]